jgi:membrane-associated HD superfamily phosphohydrolase
MGLTYTYIDKLERINCACAEHPYKDFIKKYIIFAICFLLVTAFLPPSLVVGAVGPVYGIIYLIIKWIYVIATVVFFIYALRYVQYLTREKCKCSEDIRRDVLYWWSIIQLVIFSILILLPFIIMFASGGYALAVSSGKSVVSNLDKTVMMTTVNPTNGIVRASNELHDDLSSATRSLKKTMRSLKSKMGKV